MIKMTTKNLAKDTTGIGKRLASIRGADYNQESFAKLFGISRATYANYEQERYNPDANFLAQVSKKFNIDVNWLLFGTGKMYIYKPAALPAPSSVIDVTPESPTPALLPAPAPETVPESAIQTVESVQTEQPINEDVIKIPPSFEKYYPKLRKQIEMLAVASDLSEKDRAYAVESLIEYLRQYSESG